MRILIVVVLACSFLFCQAMGAESVKVTPRFVEIKPIKYKDTEREGFALKVAFDTEDGRAPNEVSFILYTALRGWELLHCDNSIVCSNASWALYSCIRPNSAVETLYFARYDLGLTEVDKRFHHPEPQPLSEFKESLEDYFFLRVRYASAWSEAEMVEEEFCEALRQHGWKHDMWFQCTSKNWWRSADHQPDKPLVILYWADLPEEEIRQGQELVKRLAQQYGISVTTEKSRRLLSGGFVPEPVESVDLKKQEGGT